MTMEKRKMSHGAFIFNLVMSSLFFPVLILLPSGNWRWAEGWIFAVWFDALVIFNLIYQYWKDPALLVERSRLSGSDNQKSWDKYLLLFIYLVSFVWLVIMPLDAERFHWSPVIPLWVKVIGFVSLLPAFYLIERTTMENTFLSARVRIQSERKQKVISTGVYGFVRHPYYLGCVFMLLGAPLLLGSIYGLVIAVIGVFALTARIIGEEKMLVEELEGYEEYRSVVKYRLIPYIW